MASRVTLLLPELRPTELLVLLASSSLSLRQLLRLTFLELLRANVLVLENRPFQPHPYDPVTWTSYILPGPTLGTYQPREYEHLLLRPFLTQEFQQLQLRHFVKMAYQQAQHSYRVIGMIRTREPLMRFYKDTWWRRVLHMHQLTPEGQYWRERVQAELEQFDIHLNRLAQYNKAEATALGAWLGGRLFLLPTFRSPLGHQLDQALYQAQREHDSPTMDGGSGTGGIDSWHTCGQGFDSHADAAEHSGGGHHDGDSGCGGDSGGDAGCSGCSGCGGD